MSINSNKQKIINIWAVTDNKQGHQNQTDGLVQALSKYRDINLNWIPAVSLTKVIWMLLLKQCGSSNKLLPDLIVGTGHHTHMTLLALKRCFGGRVVTMMSPSLPIGLFDLCLIPRHDKPQKRYNVVETLGALNRVVPSKIHLQDKGLVLIGGPSRHFKWDSEKITKQLENLIEKNKDVEWIIAGSRRTPSDFYVEIKACLPDIKIVLPEDVSGEWLPKKIEESGQVWVSGDSISMIYEALTSGAQTGILKLGFAKSTRITEEIDRLLSESKVSTVDSISNEDLARNAKPYPPIYEADRCAKLILGKFDL